MTVTHGLCAVVASDVRTTAGSASDPGRSRESCGSGRLSAYCRPVVGRCSSRRRSGFPRGVGRWNSSTTWSGLSMKINVDVVLSVRKRSRWSQEELAIASGLNLRAIQRIRVRPRRHHNRRRLSRPRWISTSMTSTIEETRMRPTWEYRGRRDQRSSRSPIRTDHCGRRGVNWSRSRRMFNTLMTKVVYTLFLKRLVS